MKNLVKKIGMAAATMFLASGLQFAQAEPYKHVLLISIDGLHGFDVSNYAAAKPSSALAKLLRTGIFYPAAVTVSPSDSFPGMAAQVTGGSPATTGVYYDDSFDRTYFAPGSDCKGKPGAEVAFAENIDIDDTKLDAGGTPGHPETQIDPKKLPMRLADGKCVLVYPHDFVRVNNVFEVVKAHGGRTAFSDKHPAYEWLGGPSGKGLDDLYALEQDSLIPGTKSKTTGSFKAERDFDGMRVQAVINEINGLDSTGKTKADVPTLFGMNFQAVSVGQKLPKSETGDEPDLKGGYLDATGAPNTGLSKQLDYVDSKLGELVAALEKNKLSNETLIIVASKHGQSPVDPATFQPLDDDPYTKTPGYAFHIADDASLIWLTPETRNANLGPALAYLTENAKALGIGQILPPNRLATVYGDPAVDARAPDFLVTVNPGVVYTSGKKIAEHGGSNENDSSVALIVSSPQLSPQIVKGPVQTTQVAPTVLKALGIDPTELQAVKQEGTQVLPLLPF